MINRDRFGNEHAPGLLHPRGHILTSTENDFRRLRQAWRVIEGRVKQGGPDAVFNTTWCVDIRYLPRRVPSARTRATAWYWSQHQAGPPARPQPREHYPEDPIVPAESRSTH